MMTNVFFEGYKKIRQNEINANTLFEIPELFALLPDLNGKTILDMGCGFGVALYKICGIRCSNGCRN